MRTFTATSACQWPWYTVENLPEPILCAILSSSKGISHSLTETEVCLDVFEGLPGGNPEVSVKVLSESFDVIELFIIRFEFDTLSLCIVVEKTNQKKPIFHTKHQFS